MTVRATIARQMEQVAAEQFRRLAPLTDDLILLDSGLDSLCFAILVSRLEDELGVDPFADAEAIAFPVTFKDFVQFYERVGA